MNTTGKKNMLAGFLLLAAFILWTILIQIIDVQPAGQNGTYIGFSALNCWFHTLTGVNMTLYILTDWMGLIPILICMVMAGIGLMQWIRRRRLFETDADLLILGAYYLAVILCYVGFDRMPINYRPILIGGVLESSYPSSTTLLVLSVMPTLAEQSARRLQNTALRRIIRIFVPAFSAIMVLGRLICGVHWFTDIVGSVLLSAGLFRLYLGTVFMIQQKEN